MNKPQSRPGAKAPNKAKPGKQPIDPLLAQRLQQLGTRRPAGAPLPPPTPGTAATSKSATQSRSSATSAPAGSQEAKLAAAAARAAAARAAKQGGGNGRVTPPTSRRTKPAASSKVASVAISAATTLALAGWFARQDTGTTESVVLTSGTDPVNAANSTATSTAATVLTTPTTVAGGTEQTTATTQAPATTAAAATSGGIADGSYVGDGSRNRFGTVQVQVVYSGGQLTDVQILSYPDGDRRSIRINQVALPILIDEAIQAQSADINGVSGATYTSRSYVASLQSAIDNAKQASGVS